MAGNGRETEESAEGEEGAYEEGSGDSSGEEIIGLWLTGWNSESIMR